jgi:hypothetical protein
MHMHDQAPKQIRGLDVTSLYRLHALLPRLSMVIYRSQDLHLSMRVIRDCDITLH